LAQCQQQLADKEQLLKESEEKLARCQQQLQEAGNTAAHAMAAGPEIADRDEDQSTLLDVRIMALEHDPASSLQRENEQALVIKQAEQRLIVLEETLEKTLNSANPAAHAVVAALKLRASRAEAEAKAAHTALTTADARIIDRSTKSPRERLSLEVKNLEARLEQAAADLEHSRAQLKVCQKASDDHYRARTAAEEFADKQKHLLDVAREELRAAENRLGDSSAARERLQISLESDQHYSSISQESLRQRNLECKELKSTIRSLESDLKILGEDRAKLTTVHRRDLRDLERKYKAAEEGRRALELKNIALEAEIDENKMRLKELKHEVLSQEWQKHSGAEVFSRKDPTLFVSFSVCLRDIITSSLRNADNNKFIDYAQQEQRRRKDNELIHDLQEALEHETTSREVVQQQLHNQLNRAHPKKVSHLFKEPLLRETLLLKDCVKSWGRLPPSYDLPQTRSTLSPNNPRFAMDRNRPTSAPPGGQKHGMHALRGETRRSRGHIDSSLQQGRPPHSVHWSPGSFYSPPRSDSKIAYGAGSYNLLPEVHGRYHGESDDERLSRDGHGGGQTLHGSVAEADVTGRGELPSSSSWRGELAKNQPSGWKVGLPSGSRLQSPKKQAASFSWSDPVEIDNAHISPVPRTADSLLQSPSQAPSTSGREGMAGQRGWSSDSDSD
jgi:hypothetical protein